MTLVVDSSVAVAWCFADEQTDAVISVLDEVATSGGCVPAIWRLEVANALQVAVRRGRIDAGFRDGMLADLDRFDLVTDAETSRRAWTDTLMLSDRFRLTLYDACYLELAQRRGLPLATLDDELRRAANTLGVPLRGR